MTQHHRGQHPEDERLFAASYRDVLRGAVADLSFLMTRHYAEDAALKLVGDHYQLHSRQRKALLRVACSDAALAYRTQHRVPVSMLHGAPLCIDGYNLLIMIESALSGGILLRGRDGCIRDLANVHGSYHCIDETRLALHHIGETFSRLQVARACWFFDAPVSNSGRLKGLLKTIALEEGWPWEVEVIPQVDQRLSQSDQIVVTSDGWILDRAERSAAITESIMETASIKTPILTF